MKVLVTGGAGFIGSHIVEKLIAEKWEVVVLDNLSTGRRENVPSTAKLVVMDIARDNILPLFEKELFDYVIHLAAQTSVPASLENPELDCQVNIMGMIKVLEAARTFAVKRVIFPSSAAVYGSEVEPPITENAELKPSSFYGLSKLTAERYLQLYKELYGLDYVILRFANVYGERQGDGGEGGVISIFARKILSGQPLTIFGDGNQTRDFIYVKDVAAVNILALTSLAGGITANISTNTEISVNLLTEIMGKVSGKVVERVYLPAREGDIYRSCLNNSNAINTFGWNPATKLEEGLINTLKTVSE
ncbi:MAG: UDP-glucose 4-epimerase [Firmicutes bacterium]|nr:UDP-glucose 4-epimerase [Bacillota bacterium]